MAAQQVPVPPAVEPTGAKDSPVPECRIGEEANEAPTGLRADPQAWRAFLQTLEYYDPNYPYNSVYEYGPDWTDDPKYVADSVRRLMGMQHWLAAYSFWSTLKRKWGSLIQMERRILIPQGIPDRLSADNRYRVEMEGVVPDGVVVAPSFMPAWPARSTTRALPGKLWDSARSPSVARYSERSWRSSGLP